MSSKPDTHVEALVATRTLSGSKGSATKFEEDIAKIISTWREAHPHAHIESAIPTATINSHNVVLFTVTLLYVERQKRSGEGRPTPLPTDEQ